MVVIKLVVLVGLFKKIMIIVFFMFVFVWFDVLYMLLNFFKNDMIRNLICFFVFFVILIILLMFL